MQDYQIKPPQQFELPARIEGLGKLAYNLWWIWNPDAQKLFSEINNTLWEQVSHNPVAFLLDVDNSRLEKAAGNNFYLGQYDKIMDSFEGYLAAAQTWYKQHHSDLAERTIAYFSFEFGLHESLPVYAGGLGVLSGDHLKEASDLGMPVVGIGFIYNQGYFAQKITEDGWQETHNQHLDFSRMPILELLGKDEMPVTVSIRLPDREVIARVWQVQVGRVPLYLLDTNLEINSPGDRQLTARLYSNDPDVRISQEILLGIGGVRALRCLGYHPSVWHMNEGHSAFLILERIQELVDAGMQFDKASAQVGKANVFTTHTPVPAGNDQFPLWLVEKYFSNRWADLKVTREQFLDLALHTQSWGDMFSMPVLALRHSDQRNAVSELHGIVSRQMWQFLWQKKDTDEVPITHVTNGAHTCTWLAGAMAVLYERYLGTDWRDRLDDPNLWAGVEYIPDAELWAVRQHLKRRLLNHVNWLIRQKWQRGEWTPAQVLAGGALLEPNSLTIGFARRFATYKRGNLVLQDFERLLRILNDPEKPVQILFAGKAHPADEPGKLIIQQVYRAIKDSRSGGRMVFLEDYDMGMARYLVQGVDVWMNTPLRPNEASGTSGMKAGMNGVLNFSILDGWWPEGFNGSNGWAIGSPEAGVQATDQNQQDAAHLLDILENKIVPLYYNGWASGRMSEGWITRVKESIRTLTPRFCTQRMLKEYMQKLYLPALQAEEIPEVM